MLWRCVEKLDPFLKKIYQKLVTAPVPNLKGDRDLEYTWIEANMPRQKGRALGFGCGTSSLPLFAARLGFNVTAVDLVQVPEFYKYDGLEFLYGDFLEMDFQTESFDLIINASAIEHVGISGRYEVSDDREDGDIAVSKKLYNVLKPGGVMLLTIPVGQDAVFAPLHRVYGEERLPKLLEGWKIVKEEYWVKDNDNMWSKVERDPALKKKPLIHCYGLGLYVLEK